MKIIHTNSGSHLVYEKLAKERKMHDTPPNTVIEDIMELPKALQSEPKPNLQVKVQSIHELEMINFVKYMGIEIGRMCDKVEKMHDIDKRWLAIGKTDLQKGLMAVIRAIAKQETF